MKIGFFDSGSGGYYTMIQCRKFMPEYDYCFFADSKHLPFGTKTPDQIQQYTFEGIEWLFKQDCALVILACNTASAYSVRKRQALYPDKKVLSVSIPLIEQLVASGSQHIGIFATPATVASGIVQDLFERRGYAGSLELIACPGLADVIEKSLVRNEATVSISLSIEEQVQVLRSYIPDNLNSDCIGLACTHYGLWKAVFELIFPGIRVLDTADIVPAALSDYLFHHPEIETMLSRNGTTQEYRSR